MNIPSALCILTHLILTTTLGIIIPIFQMRKVSQSALSKVTEPVWTEPKLEPSQSYPLHYNDCKPLNSYKTLKDYSCLSLLFKSSS